VTVCGGGDGRVLAVAKTDNDGKYRFPRSVLAALADTETLRVVAARDGRQAVRELSLAERKFEPVRYTREG